MQHHLVRESPIDQNWKSAMSGNFIGKLIYATIPAIAESCHDIVNKIP